MNLYLYKTSGHTPLLTIENVVSYTADRAVTQDGGVYRPFAEDCELSSLEDCSEALRAEWQREHPTQEKRVEELEELVAGLLFGGENV